MKKPIKDTFVVVIAITLLGSVSALLFAQGFQKKNLRGQRDAEQKANRMEYSSLTEMLQTLPENAVLAAMANKQSRMTNPGNWDESVAFADHLIAMGQDKDIPSKLSPELLAEKLTLGARKFAGQKKQEARRLSKGAERAMTRINQRRNKMAQKYGENWLAEAEADSVVHDEL